MKKTVVLGASPNPARFSYKAVKSLTRHGHEAVPVGFRRGVIQDRLILRGTPEVNNVHTVALYVGAKRQTDFYDYILELRPKRVIFNPGTTNPELKTLLEKQGILTVEDCMLVMLNEGDF